MKIKAFISILLVLVLGLTAVSCGSRVKKKEAKEITESFLDAVETGDFAKAKGYMHPEKQIDVEKYFANLEAKYGVDFQKGIEIKRYVEYSSAIYDSEVDGGEYELDMNVMIDGIAFELNITVVRNDAGFGIYEIDLDQ